MSQDEMEQIARQLSCPHGVMGIELGDKMNEANTLITTRCIRTLAPQPGETIAEIGPGNGRLSLPIVEALGATGHYIGIEHSALMTAEAKRRLTAHAGSSITLHHCDCLRAPIQYASLDGLLAVNLLYFVTPLSQLLETIFQWMKPSGRLVLGIRSAEAMQQMPFARYGFICRSTEDILQAMQLAGFSHVDSVYYDEGNVILGNSEFPTDSLIISGRKAARP